MRRRTELLRAALRWGVSLLLLGVVAYQFYGQLDDVEEHRVTFRWLPGLLSCAGLSLFLAFSGLLWARLLRGVGGTLTRRQAFRAVFLSNLAKYLPGGVWNLVGRVAMCRRYGVSGTQASTSVLMEMVCQLAAASIIALLALPALAQHAGHDAPVALVALPLLIVIAVHPRLLNFALRTGEKLLRRELPRIPFRYGFILTTLLLYVLNWALFGVSFAALAQALSHRTLDLSEHVHLVGGFAFAWNAGVLAFVLPAGLGVREVALAFILGGKFATGWTAALALVTRLWMMLFEVLFFGAAALVRSQTARASAPDAALEQLHPE